MGSIFCNGHSYKKIAKDNFYPVGVEDLNLHLVGSAEAFRFCSEFGVQQNDGSTDVDPEAGASCPYVFALRKPKKTTTRKSQGSIRGVLLKPHCADAGNENCVLERFDGSGPIDLPVGELVKAAGVESLDAETDGVDGKTLREKGGVLVHPASV